MVNKINITTDSILCRSIIMPCSLHAKMEFNHQKSVEINKDLVVVAVTAAAADATAC